MQQRNPAIDKFGTCRWYQDDKLHRLDGPAVEYSNGDNMWYKHGLRHRINGPAIVTANGHRYWYINGVEYTKDQFRLFAFVMSQVAV